MVTFHDNRLEMHPKQGRIIQFPDVVNFEIIDVNVFGVFLLVLNDFLDLFVAGFNLRDAQKNFLQSRYANPIILNG